MCCNYDESLFSETDSCLVPAPIFFDHNLMPNKSHTPEEAKDSCLGECQAHISKGVCK